MSLKLSEKQIRKRLQQLRNYERLYPELKEKYEQAKKRIKELEEALKKEREEREESIETLKLQIEELRTMVFGKARNTDGNDDEPPASPKNGKHRKVNRSSDSYRRDTPPDDAVTDTHHFTIDACPDCKEPLCNLKEAIRYVEDILLGTPLKTVEKKVIETGFCKRCRKWHSAIPIEKQVCSLGDNVRARVVHCITVLGMTFEKVKTDLKDTFDLAISDGEIVHILTWEAVKCLPEYHAIDQKIRGSPAKHLDETGWSVQSEGEGHFGWVKTASDTVATIFRLGRSRGRGNAQKLHGDHRQPTVTDDYGAYDFLGEDQALCWAHPKRKFRDLAESRVLSKERRDHCEKFYQRFCRLFRSVKKVTESAYDQEDRKKKIKRFQGSITRLCMLDPSDPKKLATLKATFLERQKAYLLCIALPDIPMTNNKAEQSLRPLVIKRKLSFGSKTQKGADVMSILMSVAFTTWWECQEASQNFYEAYGKIFDRSVST